VGSDLFGQHADLVARLRDLVHNLGLGNRLAFVGQRNDVADLIAGSDVIVIPSRAEPFGRVALEAMALSKPVVGTNAGGLPEVVEDGRTGLLVPPESPIALGAAMRRLADDTGLRQRLGDAGAVLVRRQFTPARCASQIETVYERLLRDEGEDSP
jgi:glycosyltransferase involved in cell wall biosynthesis